GFDIQVAIFHRRQTSTHSLHPMVMEARRRGVEAEQLNGGPRLPLRGVLHLADKLKREGFSLLHTHDYKTDILGLLAARLAGVPCVATVHGYVFVSRRVRIYKMLDLLALRFFSRIITVSEDLRRELLAAGLPEEKVVTVHNVVDSTAFASQGAQRGLCVRQQLGIGRDQPLITVVARLIPGKGHRYFLEAATQVLRARSETCFLVVGEGPQRDELEKLTVALGIRHAVSFLGFRKDVATLMRASDLIVLPSLEEGLPIVLLEALALARPVVATAVGGVPEVVRHQKTGLLVPPKDRRRLAEAMLYLLSDPEEAQKLAERGKQFVSQQFNVETTAHKIAEVYREVLSSTGIRKSR
ncbi:MAG: glycosyltransferase family 4 protein, partial [Dehalococcoidia bacterium]